MGKRNSGKHSASRVVRRKKKDEQIDKKIDEQKQLDEETKEVNIDKEKGKKSKNTRTKNKKKKRIFFTLLKIILGLIVCCMVFIYCFFKTTLFQKYKELWVVTAMSTMNHQYLATWFLTDEEIQEILNRLEVVNEEDSNIDEIHIPEEVEEVVEEPKEITVEKISGKNYVGYVMIIPDPSKVELVDTRKTGIGTKLSETVKKYDAIAGMNAGGFTDPNGNGYGNILCDATIIDKKLLYGYKGTKYKLIGLTEEKKLVLGQFTYQEAIDAGIESAIEFGPYIIVNGKNQITNSTAGGIHPRTAIGQKQDGTFVFVVIDGRQPGYSIGCNFLELQNIFNRYDVYNAANLDGGSSSTLYFKDKVINKTSTPIGERYLPNAFIVNK